MISFEQAYGKVMDQARSWGEQTVPLAEATGRVLAEAVRADRDFPPFDRSTKDGIAVNYSAVDKGGAWVDIERTARAGMPRTRLEDPSNGIEIMTGAVLPEQADTVVMYEHIEIRDGRAKIVKMPEQGQNIHTRGSDKKQGDPLLEPPLMLTPAEIGVLATVGMDTVAVKRRPEVAIISTGDELVDVHQQPQPHQIRKSNVWSLRSALAGEGIRAEPLHMTDDRDSISAQLSPLLKEKDVLLISGGVSKGKFDYLPRVLEDLGVRNLFHFVKQKPGKPFWFGVHGERGTAVFSFPGNPVSTFANYHVYFRNWLRRCLGLPDRSLQAILDEEIGVSGTLTRFLIVKTTFVEGMLKAIPVSQGGSGDLASLAAGDGFIRLEPRSEPYGIGESVPFYATRPLM